MPTPDGASTGYWPGNYGDYSLLPIGHDPYTSGPETGAISPAGSGGPSVTPVAWRGEPGGEPALELLRQGDFKPLNPMQPGGGRQWSSTPSQALGPPTGSSEPYAAPGPADPATGQFSGQVHPSWISTRAPSGAKALADPLADQLTISQAAMSPDHMAQALKVMRTYPNFTDAERAQPDEQFAKTVVDHAKSNILWLHDQVSPDIAADSSKWYDGANYIAQHRADYYNKPMPAVAGVYAALSPQKDWFQNVNLGDRVMHIMTNYSDTPWTPDMTNTANRIFWKKEIGGVPPDKQALIGKLQGSTINSLDDPVERAHWLRTFDETYHDRAYPTVNPDGTFGDTVMTEKGKPRDVAWGSAAEISKAMQAFQSDGSKQAMSQYTGEGHKVRNFYNNILDPNSPAGDVTIDTHAVAAGLLRPLSGNTPEVAHNFGNSLDKKYQPPGYEGSGGSSTTGAYGTYGLFADAYRQAAAERGMLPRQMQSITWEAVRGLYNDKYKKVKGNPPAISGMWNQRNEGASIDDIRQAALQHAGGIDPPAWYKPTGQ